MSFIWLENHSVYSLCSGTISIPELISHAKSNSFSYLTIADTNGFYGLVNFVQECDEADIKTLIGVRLEKNNYTALLIAKSMRGYAYISEIITWIHLKEDFDLKDYLLNCKNKDYLIITSDTDILHNKKRNIYGEINILNKNYATVYKVARDRRIPPVLICPVYFQYKKDFKFHKLLRAIYHCKKIEALKEGEFSSAGAYFRDEKELLNQYANLQDALHNTRKLADEAYFKFQYGKVIFPKVSDDSFSTLREKCITNIPKRYKKKDLRKAKDRLVHELEIIKKTGFSNYFLVVDDIVSHAQGYTIGRGSSAGSIVNFLLFVTHVDPIEHNLYFERFLNLERPDPPDIDIDFPWDQRDDTFDYLFAKYSDKAAMVANHNTFKTKSSVREIAKCFGLPEKEIKKFNDNVVSFYLKENANYSEANNAKTKANVWNEIKGMAVRINGIPRHLGLHCGGTIVTPFPIRYYVPVQKATKGYNEVQWEKDQVEDFGLVKLDLLGNRSLAVVRDCIDMIKENYNIDIDYKYLNPIHDKDTQKLIESGQTMGCFYIESPATRQLQKKAKRGDYFHLNSLKYSGIKINGISW